MAAIVAFPVFADTPTYICTNANGTKAIQDQPCHGGQKFNDALLAKKNAPPPPKPFDPQACMRRSRCRYHTEMRDIYAKRNAEQYIAKDRADSNEERRRHQSRIDGNC